jgi:adenosylmethionine-8-amino-7-oxononanoate aminotransferase
MSALAAAPWEAAWPPYRSLADRTPPLEVTATYGSRIVLADGRELIDGVASWWTAVHGYTHPHLLAALRDQAERMPHVMFAGLTHAPARRLANRLIAKLPPGFARVFFSESGSVAVEVALKVALQAWRNRGEPQRDTVLAFRHGYHGDTFGAMAVSDGIHAPDGPGAPRVCFASLPVDAPSTRAFERLVAAEGARLAAMIVEPLVQGAGGMRFHDAAALARVRAAADSSGAILIFDEIFTGFGRTGTLFALEGAGVVPDIVTFGKGLTGGVTPLAVTVVRASVAAAFCGPEAGAVLAHGPTFMGHALGCAVANASLDLFETEPRREQAAAIEAQLREELRPCARFAHVRDVRICGAIGVVELAAAPDLDALRAAFVAVGVWLRPFGRVVYATPPLTTTPDELSLVTHAIVTQVRGLAS